MRISDWSSDVCSSDLLADSRLRYDDAVQDRHLDAAIAADAQGLRLTGKGAIRGAPVSVSARGPAVSSAGRWPFAAAIDGTALAMTAKRSAEHTSEFQSLMRISYAVFCLQ